MIVTAQIPMEERLDTAEREVTRANNRISTLTAERDAALARVALLEEGVALALRHEIMDRWPAIQGVVRDDLMALLNNDPARKALEAIHDA